jgi:hypothetical protein
MSSYSVDGNEAMKHDDEALNASLLPIFYSAFNASSLLLDKRESSFNASSPLFF